MLGIGEKNVSDVEAAIEILKNGGVGILGTDTIYGIVSSALYHAAVERVYEIKNRNLASPSIILIYGPPELIRFGIKPSSRESEVMQKVWPGEVSVILPCPEDEFKYLHRGTKTLAFRVPDREDNTLILKEVGPLIAPSANPEGETPAATIEKAWQYFGNSVDFYLDSGELVSKPSTLIAIEDGRIVVKREGKYDTSQI